MKIYLFTINHPENGLTIVQVYSNCYYFAYWALVKLEDCKPEDINLQGMDTTGCPKNWIGNDEFTNYYK